MSQVGSRPRRSELDPGSKEDLGKMSRTVLRDADDLPLHRRRRQAALRRARRPVRPDLPAVGDIAAGRDVAAARAGEEAIVVRRCGETAKPVSQNGRQQTTDGRRKMIGARTARAIQSESGAETIADMRQKDNMQRKTKVAKEPEQPKV